VADQIKILISYYDIKYVGEQKNVSGNLTGTKKKGGRMLHN
jgi:hypothetical protein